MYRCFFLLVVAIAWCSATSMAPVPVPAARTTLYVPLVGVPASVAVVPHPSVTPFVTWPLQGRPCTPLTALAVLRRDVVIAGQPMGHTEAWSCTSVAEAQTVLDAGIALITIQSWCWYHVGTAPPANTACPARPQAIIDAQARGTS